jgi:CheY-like chemotaxis protein
VSSSVLFIDDDSTFRDGMKKLLFEEGRSVRTARDGAEALEWLSRSPVEVVVGDVDMPGIDGLTFVRELRRRGDRTPVVLTSPPAKALPERPDIRYLWKPIDPVELVVAVEGALSHDESCW